MTDHFVDVHDMVIQSDRDAAAAVAVLVEMRDLIRAGKADHHAEPFARHRLAERARIVAWLRTGCAFCETDQEIADAIEGGGA